MKNVRLTWPSHLLVSCVLTTLLLNQSASAAIWQTAGGGNWDETANWDTGNVPDTSTETAVFNVVNGGPYYVVLNDTMYPGGLTTNNLVLSPGHPNIGLTRFYQLDATGAGTLDWTFGDAVNEGTLLVQRSQLNLTNTNLDFLGTSATDTIRLIQLAPNHAGNEWSVDAVNSTISVTAAPASSTANGLAISSGGTMRMTGGELTITNGTNNAQTVVTGFDTNRSQASHMVLNGTTFTTNQLQITADGEFTFDGAGASSPSDVSGTLSISTGGKASLNSGEIDFAAIDISTTGVGKTNNVSVNGATVNVAGAVVLKTSSSTTVGPTAAQPDQLFITAGSLTAASLEAGGAFDEKGAFEVNVSGTGSLDIAGTLQLGWDDTSNRHGAGTLIISGGSVKASFLEVGATLGDANSVGYYEQTGGVAEFGSIQLSRDNAGGSGYGTKEFVVGTDAELRITGAGFSQFGQGEWLVDDGPGTLDFSGTLVFDPNALTSQTLLAFGQELTGTLPDSPDTISAVIADNYGIGTLDLSNLDGAEVLNVLPSFNELENALFVGALLGVTDATVADHLDSEINIYYSASLSPSLNKQSILLNSGGLLIPLVAIPEPSSLWLMSMGTVIGIMRRRRKPRC